MFKSYRRYQVKHFQRAIGLAATSHGRNKMTKRFEKLYKSFVLQYNEDPLTGERVDRFNTTI